MGKLTSDVADLMKRVKALEKKVGVEKKETPEKKGDKK